MNEFWFYIVILLSHIIQGITGFAGTLLAMPFSLMLVGSAVAVPVLNGLGLLSGAYVYLGNKRDVVRKELLTVLAVMIPGMLLGIWLRGLLASRGNALFITLGAIVLVIAARGLYDIFVRKGNGMPTSRFPAVRWAMLILAGIVHGMFVCGGPLLIGYLAERFDDKAQFRATLGTSWLFLNGLLLITQIIAGDWNGELLRMMLIAAPVLFASMFIGGRLYKHMSQRFFMILTYVLLVISGVTLFFK